MTKALLLLSGGRSLPDMLILKYLRPDITINLTTLQGRANALYFQQFTQAHFGLTMEVPPAINPFDEQEIRDACQTALQRYPDVQWSMHITTSPKMMGIYAHTIAREHNIPCLFLDTDGKQVISSVRQSEIIDTHALFKATTEEYMQAYGRTYEIPKSLSYRQKVEAWDELADALAHRPEETQLFLQAIREKRPDPLKLSVSKGAEQLLLQLESLAAIHIITVSTDKLSCVVVSQDHLEFFKGDWLEVYVWKEALKAHFADDCQWGYKIKADLPANELDLILTYHARLLIAECKTSKEPFKTEHLYKLHSIAELVGGNYVRQVFITNCPKPREKDDQYDNFLQQAKVRRTTVITGEQLREIGILLQHQIVETGKSH